MARSRPKKNIRTRRSARTGPTKKNRERPAGRSVGGGPDAPRRTEASRRVPLGAPRRRAFKQGRRPVRRG